MAAEVIRLIRWLPESECSTWRVVRNGGTDQNGEWVPGPGWTATLEIETITRPRVRCELLLSVHSDRRGRASGWSLIIRWGDISRLITDGRKCQSVAQACARARRWVEQHPEDVVAFLRECYAPRWAKCVFKLEEDGQWHPFATAFGMAWDIQSAFMCTVPDDLPTRGRFVVVSFGSRISVREAEITWTSYSSGPLRDPDRRFLTDAEARELAVRFLETHEVWIPRDDLSSCRSIFSRPPDPLPSS